MSDSGGVWSVALQDCLPGAGGATLAAVMETFGLEGHLEHIWSKQVQLDQVVQGLVRRVEREN